MVDINKLVQDLIRESYEETGDDMEAYAGKVKKMNALKEQIREQVKELRGHQSAMEENSNQTGVISITPKLIKKTEKAMIKVDQVLNLANAPINKQRINKQFKKLKKKLHKLEKDLIPTLNSKTKKRVKKLEKIIPLSGRSKINEILSALNRNPNLTPNNFFQTIEKKGKQLFPELKVEEIDMVKALTYALWIKQLKELGEDAQLSNIDMQNQLQKQQEAMNMLSNLSKQLHETAMAIIRKLG